MSAIKASDIIAWQNAMMTWRDEDGNGYSPTYLKTIHNQCSAIFNHAVRYYELKSNPAAKAGNMGKEKTKEDQLELFIREHPNTQLIIIDTLQKVRELSGESYSYASDYEIIGKLKMFADKHGICLLLVHHTRKQPASDKFEMISGTTGLLGCADGVFLLQKERGIAMNATLDVVGRDQPEQKIFLIRDREHLNWTLDHIEAESTVQPPNPILEKVNTFLKGTWTGTPTDLVQLLEMELKPNVLSIP